MTDHSILKQRSSFPCWARDTLRFSDTDRLGHVNNTAYATFCESGRLAFLGQPLRGADFVIVRLVINFHREIFYPGAVDVGTCTLRLGRSSISMGQGLFADSQCVATAEGTCALIDLESRRPVAIPDDARRRFESLQCPAPPILDV